MATATLALTTPSEGIAWTVTISGTGVLTSSAVNSDSSYNSATVSVTAPSLGSVFTMPTSTDSNSFQTYGGQYATWRSSSAVTGLSYSQYPTQGLSLDIWGGSSNLITNIDSNNDWSTIAGTYSLSTTKWSLIYNYSELYAPIYSKGGTLTISVA
jgi:hypothetical protein